MNKQRGNILFLILLAVVLFAALAYAVTSSMRGGGKDASSEKARAQASALIQYVSLIQNTVQRTMLMNNIPEYGLDFSADSSQTQSGINNTCTQTSCRIFNRTTREGMMTVQKFGEEYVDPRWRAGYPSYGGGAGLETVFNMIVVVDIGTSAPELIVRFVGIRPEICKAINDILWNTPTGYGNEAYSVTGSGSNYTYSGTLTAMPTEYGTLGDETPFFYRGKQAGCVGRELNTIPYGGDFYTVLMER